ncbi:MAG: type IV-A pilus assembly ATPase PilB [Neisseria sp.]|nr:type IV-A pilus assembly ATPase PilB [Neisseria sp.]
MSAGLIRVLQQNHIINNEQASFYLQHWQQQHNLLPRLFDDNIISPRELAELLARFFHYPLLDLSHYAASHLPNDILSEQQIQQFQCLPIFKRGKQIYFAVSDPTRIQDYQKLAFAAGYSLDLIIVRHDQLLALIEAHSQGSTAILQEMTQEVQEFAAQSLSLDDDSEDGPIARFVHKTLLNALNVGASDVHLEFYENKARIRFRIDGVLREVAQPPLDVRNQLASRIKVMARLDIAEKRVPQDGRLQIALQKNGKAFDVRVSTLPTIHGEKIVLRILDPNATALDIDVLGLEDFQKTLLLDAIRRPYGMVLVTGPTGSGKTVSLYTCLSILNTENVNIATAEDPAEIMLSGVNQVNVNDKQGLNFAVALRAFLRQDPDIIMVGEMRDLETADIAIKAAQTGHMVFSTLHTNNAPASLSRLLNMGVAPFNIASSVSLIMAQRLLRQLCPECKMPSARPPESVLKNAGFQDKDLQQNWTLYRAVGCDFCRGKGYKGRIGVFEMMPVSAEMQRVILNGGHEADIQKMAYQEGMVDLRRAALLKVMAGITSLEEALACTNTHI